MPLQNQLRLRQEPKQDKLLRQRLTLQAQAVLRARDQVRHQATEALHRQLVVLRAAEVLQVQAPHVLQVHLLRVQEVQAEIQVQEDKNSYSITKKQLL